MKPNEQEIKDAYALRDALKSKSQFRPDYSRDRFEQMMKQQEDAIKQSEFKHFTDIVKYIPEIRRKIPKSEQETSIKLLDEYNSNITRSTFFTIPVTFFAFCNKYVQSKIGRPGTFILSIASTTMITLGNMLIVQQIVNKERIDRLTAICAQYKPIIRDQNNLNFVKFIQTTNKAKELILNDEIGDRVYSLSVEQQKLYETGKRSIQDKVKYQFELYALEREVSQEARDAYDKAQEQIKRVDQKKELERLKKEQQQQEQQKLTQQQQQQQPQQQQQQQQQQQKSQ